MIIAPDDDDEVAELLDDQEGCDGAMSSSSELEARIGGLRAELEFERRMRRKAEALAAELALERRRSEAAEAECRALREEAALALESVEEERRMLRVAELWREERVQMRLADARAAVEEKLREIDDAVARIHATTVIAGRDSSKMGSSCCSSPDGGGKLSCSASQQGQQSPSQSQHGQLHRREPAGGGENPHIRRGIKGFVEFPRAMRVRPRDRDRDDRVDLVSNLECQHAQLCVLMRHRSPAAAGIGLIGGAAPENLVV